ncbi:MAG: hypothetical protein LUF92_11085 [Clostridiales bacterium]|nr:hypothetical protein [Clostridiales bacterium]
MNQSGNLHRKRGESMVVYTIEYAPPLIVIVLAIIFWRIYRRENRIRN